MGVRLPAEYQEVEWIEGSRNAQFIDSGIPGNINTLIIEAKVKPGAYAQYAPLWGNYEGENYNVTRLIAYNTNSILSYINVKAGSGTSPVSIPQLFGTDKSFVIRQERTRLIIDGTAYTISVSTTASENSKNIAINASRPDNPSTSNQSVQRWYYFRMFNQETKLRDFVPCYRKADSKPGMYDLVSKVFYTNQGTGEFLVGPDVVNHVSPRLMDRRRVLIAKLTSLLEYIATSENGVVRFNANVSKPTTVICEVTPKQDLHGYDHPWPAGVGLIPVAEYGTKTVNGVTITSNNGVYTKSGVASDEAVIRFNLTSSFVMPPSDGTYAFCIFNNISGPNDIHLRLIFSDESFFACSMLYSVNRVISSWGNDHVGKTCVAIEVLNPKNKGYGVTFSPQFLPVNQIDTFIAGSNICPIEGHDECDIKQVGKNFIPTTDDGFTIRTVNGTSVRTIAIKSYAGAVFHWTRNNRGPLAFSAYWCDKLASNITATKVAELTGYNDRIISDTDGHEYFLLVYPIANSLFLIQDREGCLTVGSEDSSYEEHKEEVLPLIFNQTGDHAFLPIQEGTGDPSPENVRPIHPGLTFTRDDDSVLSVYGGTLTVNSDGTSSIVSKYVKYNLPTTGWSKIENNTVSVFSRIRNDVFLEMPIGSSNGGIVIFDQFRNTTTLNAQTTQEYAASVYNASNNYIRFSLPLSYDSASQAEEWLTEHMPYVVYETNTISTYTLSVTETNRALEALGLTPHIGTLYGGTITINPDGSADVEVAYQKISFDGSENWSVGQSGTERWFYRIATPYSAPTQYPITESVVSNMYPVVPISSTGDGSEKGCYLTYNGDMRIRWGTQDLNKFKALLTEVPLEYVYPLATPQTYHFSNLEQLKTFLGENNFWCDISDDITVKYWNRG